MGGSKYIPLWTRPRPYVEAVLFVALEAVADIRSTLTNKSELAELDKTEQTIRRVFAEQGYFPRST